MLKAKANLLLWLAKTYTKPFQHVIELTYVLHFYTTSKNWNIFSLFEKTKVFMIFLVFYYKVLCALGMNFYDKIFTFNMVWDQ